MKKLILALLISTLAACGGGSDEPPLMANLPAPIACFKDPGTLQFGTRYTLEDCSTNVVKNDRSTGLRVNDVFDWHFINSETNGFTTADFFGGAIPTFVAFGPVLQIRYCIKRIVYIPNPSTFNPLGEISSLAGENCDIRTYIVESNS